MTGFISTLVEAWQELRINKVRILLALLGVALSVAALTSVVGVGSLAREGMKVQSERNGGRVATLSLNVQGPTMPDPVKLEKAYQGIQQRYGITTSTHVSQTQAGFQFPPRGVTTVNVTIVDVGYGVIHRVPLQQGSWFAADDGKRLAPAVVVSESFYNQSGRPNLTTHPTVSIPPGDQPATAVIIGVVPDSYPDAPPSAFILAEGAAMTGIKPQMSEFKIWVGEAQAGASRQQSRPISKASSPGYYAHANRMDYAAWGDPLAPVQMVVGGVAGLVLLLGAVGMLNISMVTVRYRVREIGIRRSFGGATSGRIFVGVMMESVVATAVAGLAGVMLQSQW